LLARFERTLHMQIIQTEEFFGIALGSLRESQTWYTAVATELPIGIVQLRLEQLTDLRKLLIGAQKWLNSKPKPTQLM
jgi:hypothetical protein